MAERAIAPATIPKTYAELRDAVLAVVHKGRREIERARVESYHEIGRHIYALYPPSPRLRRTRALTPAEIKLVEESSAPKASVT